MLSSIIIKSNAVVFTILLFPLVLFGAVFVVGVVAVAIIVAMFVIDVVLAVRIRTLKPEFRGIAPPRMLPRLSLMIDTVDIYISLIVTCANGCIVVIIVVTGGGQTRILHLTTN